MDIDKINRLREERRRKKAEQTSSAPNERFFSKNQTDSASYDGKGKELNIDECKREFKIIEGRIVPLIQQRKYDEASQELSYFYNTHKSQDRIGGEFYRTFGFWLEYWDLYIELSKYEDRIIKNEHNTQSYSFINAEKDIEIRLKELRDWKKEDESYSRKIEYLNSRYENAKNSKDNWTEKGAYKECKLLDENMTHLIKNKKFEQAGETLLDFFESTEKTYADHKDILTGIISFNYLYWKSYLDIKILENYANPNIYDKDEVKKLKDLIDKDLDYLRKDKVYIETYPSKITSLYEAFENSKKVVKKNNTGEKEPWTAGCGGAVIVFIIVLICKLIWDWGAWTLFVWPIVGFIFAFVGEKADD